MIVRVNGQVLQSSSLVLSNVADEGASKGWVAQQIADVIQAVGDAITDALLNVLNRIADALVAGAIEVATIGSVAVFVYYCYRLMFGDDSEKTFTGMYFSAIVYIRCCVAKGGIL